MRKNRSPWLHQLDAARPTVRLSHDIETDVAIVGAGIAGIASAFFALKYSDARVTLLEKFRLAHGATGHNAGQVVSYFERGFASIASEFGPTLAAAGQRAVDDAWQLIDEMYSDAGLDIPFSRFLGHAGFAHREQVLWHLENNAAKRDAGISTPLMQIADDAAVLAELPARYDGLYEKVPAAQVRELLETQASTYIAVLSTQKGCINSALFCQEVLTFLQRTYPERFALYEEAPVRKILLHTDHAILDVETHTVRARRVALCTNGFEHLHIINNVGLDIDARYHHLVSGKVGYMSGYLETMNKQPAAISYYKDAAVGMDNSYYYLTRRPFEYESGMHHNLISIGGPDMDIDERMPYSFEDEYPEGKTDEIDAFLRETYDLDPNKKVDFVFAWHGLMGYTAHGLRLIGPEPQNPVLLYNLGCNGVGILPSLYGGRTLARHIAGESVAPSIFDVPRTVRGS